MSKREEGRAIRPTQIRSDGRQGDAEILLTWEGVSSPTAGDPLIVGPTGGAASGTPTAAVTHTGTMTANDVIIGNGGADVTASGVQIGRVKIRSFGASFDGSGAAIPSGKVAYVTVPFAGTISAWNITVDTGTCTIDIWKIATGTAIPTVTNTITASAKPAISTGTAVHSTTRTGWTTSVAANDIVGIHLDAVSSATLITLVVEVTL